MSTQQPWSILSNIFQSALVSKKDWALKWETGKVVANLYNAKFISKDWALLISYFIGYIIFVWFACKYSIIPSFFFIENYKYIYIKAEFIRIENSKHIEHENILIFLLASPQICTVHSVFHHQASHEHIDSRGRWPERAWFRFKHSR